MRMYAPDGYEGTLMCLEEAVERAEWSGCRVIGVYREPVLADINVADLSSYVIDWIGDELRYDDALSWDEGGPLLGVDYDSHVEAAAAEALHDAIKALLEASLDLSEAAWQHERDIWLPEWPGGCDRLWGVRCETAPALPGWDPRSFPCPRERHGNSVRSMPPCEVPA